MRKVSTVFRLAIALALLCVFGFAFSQAQKADAGKEAATSSKTAKSTKAKHKVKKTEARKTGVGHTAAGLNSTTKKAPAAQLVKQDPSVADKEFSTKQISGIVPREFNGDVRKLPQVAVKPIADFEAPEPPNFKPTPSGQQLAAEAARAKGFEAAAQGIAAPAPPPTVGFDGMSLADTCTGGQCGTGYPPDVNGEVGLDHYIQSVNGSYAIYSKAGVKLAAFTENALWAGTGGTCDGKSEGDPVVLYDQVADRWILTNFAFANPLAAPYSQCFAVSKSGDPVSGGWWLYEVRIDGQGGVPLNTLNDYPKFGLWTDCLYMGANGFLNNGGSYGGAIFASLSKSDMYAGNTLTGAIGWLPGNTNFTLIPANYSGTATSQLPPPGTPAYFASESQTAFGIDVRKFTAGPNCGGGGVLSAVTTAVHANYSSSGGNNVPQLNDTGNTHRLDTLGDRLMQKVQYRRIGATESLWVVHTGPVSNSVNAKPQWVQVNVTGGTISTTPVQQQIYTPDSTVYRWMPAIATDNAGNTAVAYSTSNTTMFPSLAYSGRLATDPVNTLPQTETQLAAGKDSQIFLCGGAACHRWGDYFSLSVDPTDDCTFWHTGEYYSAAGNGSQASRNWNTRISAFKFPSCTPITPVLAITKTHVGNFTQGQTGAQYTINVTNDGPGYIHGGVNLADALPAGLTATAISGSGWTCTLGTVSCTRGDTLAANSSYPIVTVTVNVAGNAPSLVTNLATISGGGAAANATANDPTTITALVPDLTIAKSHSGNFTQNQPGSYTITVSNVGNGGTSGAVNMTDSLPAGLVASSLSGAGWSCSLGTLSCSRSDVLSAGASYAAITLAVNVASNAPASVINTATVSGGGETNSSNDTANDPTTINPANIVPGTVQLTVTVPSLTKLQNGSYQANVMVVNNGTGTAVNANLTAATLGAASGSVVPQSLGNIAPNGGFVNVTIIYPASAGASNTTVVEKYSGTYNGGTFGANIRALLP